MNDAQTWSVIGGVLTVLCAFLALVIRSLERTMGFGLASLTARFDQVDSRFDQVDSRFDQVDSRFDRLETRFDRLEVRVDGIDRDVTALARRDMGGA